MARHKYTPKLLKEVEPPAELPSGKDWDYEFKWDGWRALPYMLGQKAVLLSRGGMDITTRYPLVAREIPEAFSGHRVIADGELIGLKDGHHSLRTLREEGALAVLIVFDLMELDGEPLVDEPLDVRRLALREVFQQSERIALSPVFDNPDAVRTVAKQSGYEGVVAKRKSSLYKQRGNNRDGNWQKLKFEVYDRKLAKYNERRRH